MNEEADEERAERDHRTFVNLVAAIVLLALVIAGYWLMNFLDGKRKLEACLEAGRRNCQEMAPPP